MKASPSIARLAIALLALNSAVPAAADQLARHARPEELLGSWVGYDEGCLGFYRLILSKGGRGVCITLFREELAGKYPLSWRLEGADLLIELTPTNREPGQLSFSVTYFDLVRIEAVLRETQRSWERKAILYNEREFMRRLKKTGANLKSKHDPLAGQ